MVSLNVLALYLSKIEIIFATVKLHFGLIKWILLYRRVLLDRLDCLEFMPPKLHKWEWLGFRFRPSPFESSSGPGSREPAAVSRTGTWGTAMHRLVREVQIIGSFLTWTAVNPEISPYTTVKKYLPYFLIYFCICHTYMFQNNKPSKCKMLFSNCYLQTCDSSLVQQ